MRLWRLARVLLGSQYAVMLEYRAEIALWALAGVLPLIMLGLWSDAGAAAAAGLSGSQLSRYFLSVFVVRQFTIVWVMFSFEEDSLEGRLSPYLLQPLPPFWRYVSAHLSEQLTRLPFVALMLAGVVMVHPASFWRPSPVGALLALLATMAAFWVRFLLHWIFAMLCFWSERASAVDRLLLIPYLFLSGLVAPLETFPENVRRLAMATPFPYFLAFPARLLAGEPVDVAAGFLALAGWGLLLLPISIAAWRLGVRRYSAMGA
ncbi:multidrug ABC transporter permease [Synechococcus sp. RSCCF101]|uniref:ABC transporter permease n=1 Tax=Synechococcus sp. RSCCF101 TaxID=2511069 RepID=UPI00124619FB|nr:ABC-2 family transporter protein [Synechococcus sp. RSCCF101]QEY31287.1 multidrug ABC transporter permease [Synechococcus sp. RSCCF101]